MSRAAKAMSELIRAREVPLSIALVGPGTVGKALLEQLRVESPNLLKRYGINIQVHGITNSKAMILSPNGQAIDLQSWQDRLMNEVSVAVWAYLETETLP